MRGMFGAGEERYGGLGVLDVMVEDRKLCPFASLVHYVLTMFDADCLGGLGWWADYSEAVVVNIES